MAYYVANMEDRQRAQVKRAAQHRQRYATLREHGLCVRCKQPAQPGKVLCWSCQLYNNQRRSGARQAPRG